jgi:hypothetical protein
VKELYAFSSFALRDLFEIWITFGETTPRPQIALRRSCWKNVNHWLGCRARASATRLHKVPGFVFPRLLIPDRLQTKNRPVADSGDCSWGTRGKERPARTGFVRIKRDTGSYRIPFASTQSYRPALRFLNSSTLPFGHRITTRSMESRLPSPNVTGSSDCER